MAGAISKSPGFKSHPVHQKLFACAKVPSKPPALLSLEVASMQPGRNLDFHS